MVDLWRREHGDEEARSLLSAWVVDRPGDWLRRVNRAERQSELNSLHLSIARGRPFGTPDWTAKTVR